MNRLNTTQKNDNLIKENTTQKVYTYFEGFAGIGAQACALHRLEERLTNVRFECVGISEFDDTPVKAYEALNGPAKNYGDITKIDWSLIPHIDILTWSSPCQDVSTAGKGKGLVKGSNTRSSLAWELMKLLDTKKDDLPSLIIFENVKGILQKKHKGTFLEFAKAIEGYGYSVSYQILDANDHGTAQHRERVFCVAVLSSTAFVFPGPRADKVVLGDILEKDSSAIPSYNSKNPILRSYNGKRTLRIHNPNSETGYTLTTKGIGRTEDNYFFRNAFSNEPVVRVTKKFLETHNISLEELLKADVRGLTVNEAMRLMGFDKEEIARLEQSGLCKTDMYYCLGNSICPPVLEDIFETYLKDYGHIDEMSTT